MDTQLVRFSTLATRALRPVRWLDSTVLSRAQLQGRATNGAGIQPRRTMRSSIVAANGNHRSPPAMDTQRRFGAERTGPFCDPIRLAKRGDQARACDRAWGANRVGSRTSLVAEPRWFRTSEVRTRLVAGRDGIAGTLRFLLGALSEFLSTAKLGPKISVSLSILDFSLAPNLTVYPAR